MNIDNVFVWLSIANCTRTHNPIIPAKKRMYKRTASNKCESIFFPSPHFTTLSFPTRTVTFFFRVCDKVCCSFQYHSLSIAYLQCVWTVNNKFYLNCKSRRTAQLSKWKSNKRKRRIFRELRQILKVQITSNYWLSTFPFSISICVPFSMASFLIEVHCWIK